MILKLRKDRHVRSTKFNPLLTSVSHMTLYLSRSSKLFPFLGERQAGVMYPSLGDFGQPRPPPHNNPMQNDMSGQGPPRWGPPPMPGQSNGPFQPALPSHSSFQHPTLRVHIAEHLRTTPPVRVPIFPYLRPSEVQPNRMYRALSLLTLFITSQI